MRLTYAEIDIQHLKHNLRCLKERAGGVALIAVVKANAYGHGMIPVARAVVEAGADYLGAGFLEEGLVLRRAGIAVPILVMGGVLFSQVEKFIRNDLEITVSSLPLAYEVNRTAAEMGEQARIHLKFDTGMNRIGMSHKDPERVFKRLVGLSNLDIVGIYSHLASADEKDRAFTNLQIRRFRKIAAAAAEHGIRPKYLHLANSSAILRYPSACFTMVRAGIAMYGIYPSEHVPRRVELLPVLTFKSRVVFLKKVPAHEGISYGLRHVTPRPTWIATIPVGYGDGYMRALSGRAEVLIRGRRRPIVGTICMDQFMVDLGPETDVQVGDEVVLYGHQGGAEIGVDEIARLAGTIPYEIVCALSRRVPRVTVPHSVDGRAADNERNHG